MSPVMCAAPVRGMIRRGSSAFAGGKPGAAVAGGVVAVREVVAAGEAAVVAAVSVGALAKGGGEDGVVQRHRGGDGEEGEEEVVDQMVEDNFSFGKKKKSGAQLPASMAAIAERAQGDPVEAEFLNLAKMDLTELPDLSVCERLKRLDLSANKLSSAEGIGGARNVLVLSSYQLEKVAGLNSLIANNNLISSFEGITGLAMLNSLVLSHNKITEIAGISSLRNLKKLSLAHNQITEIAGSASLRNLKKLSLAHNQIRILPDLCAHPLLEELRLNDNRIMKKLETRSNNRAMQVPPTIDRSPALKLVDLGRNRLFDISDVQNISQCRRIKNLNLL
ncbi:hypothetical protein T484DRAFT_1782915, partial [Baffinella frigidus]